MIGWLGLMWSLKLWKLVKKINELLETRWMINSTPFFFANAHLHPFFIQGVDSMSK
jgi:hypothetical protein